MMQVLKCTSHKEEIMTMRTYIDTLKNMEYGLRQEINKMKEEAEDRGQIMERIEEQIKQEVQKKNCIGARLNVNEAELKESNFHYQEEMNKKEKK